MIFQELTAAIMEATKMNPHMTVEKIEVRRSAQTELWKWKKMFLFPKKVIIVPKKCFEINEFRPIFFVLNFLFIREQNGEYIFSLANNWLCKIF